jgi:signal transduction histidine kinase
VVLTVTDEGPGVAVADRGRIWEPFVRAADGGPAGGTGLGLAVVRDLVAGLNGTARVESPAGAGARFVVELPGCPAATPDPARRDSLAGDRQ